LAIDGCAAAGVEVFARARVERRAVEPLGIRVPVLHEDDAAEIDAPRLRPNSAY
jgi:hypothetical protein